MIPLKHFYMIRHGETEANVARMMAGSLDSPLTARGREQAAKAADIVAALSEKPAVIIHSHLSRARETAEIINTRLRVPLAEEPGLAEMHAGDWEGKPWEHCSSLFDDWCDAPNGETAQGFFDRIRAAKTSILEQYTQRVLMVSHGGVFRAFGAMYGHMRVPPTFRNCELHEFQPRPENMSFPWEVRRYADESSGYILSENYHPEDETAAYTCKA